MIGNIYCKPTSKKDLFLLQLITGAAAPPVLARCCCATWCPTAPRQGPPSRQGRSGVSPRRSMVEQFHLWVVKQLDFAMFWCSKFSIFELRSSVVFSWSFSPPAAICFFGGGLSYTLCVDGDHLWAPRAKKSPTCWWMCFMSFTSPERILVFRNGLFYRADFEHQSLIFSSRPNLDLRKTDNYPSRSSRRTFLHFSPAKEVLRRTQSLSVLTPGGTRTGNWFLWVRSVLWCQSHYDTWHDTHTHIVIQSVSRMS